tara:strand:+ start:586 stop:963 length:378 start_codon:yes stop_codon:yes gene_type:complete
MSNTTDKMLDRYVYLDVDTSDLFCPDEKEQGGITVHVKMDDEGVVVDAWGGEDKCIASTWKTYAEMGVEAIAVETLEELRDKARKWDEYIKSVIKNTGDSMRRASEIALKMSERSDPTIEGVEDE